ncbi:MULTISPECIES: patatin-like phospholipase family protein [unclassified Psychrobacter]|uniref:patatin-like phospholipase family protein n=1 Tax=unclassified Psychrobacter TaxID=196806 RepID=UPI0025B42B1D|nr:MULTISPECIES: patatin-like phospholipase family protein [unclassified Psychrobacter]MDN3452039.1 patatin-like phospholipase family protein [Psychrobacter sp. APC 3350]MDN3501339.1 patatin-like phospholipase family protein [Psychrobacter sp. 5A.1]
MTNNRTKPYERVQLFSGGGSRFGYYLGSYAALVAHDLTPDIIVGTCGGSLSAYLVQLAPDPKDLQALMCSRELSRTIAAIRHVAPDEANRRAKMRYMTSALNRWRLSKQQGNGQRQQQADSYGQLLDELQQLAMFRIDDEARWLDELSSFASSENGSRQSNASIPEIAIIASRLYQAPIDGLYNEQLKLQELLFAPPRFEHSASNLTDEKLRSPAQAFANERIHPSVKVETQWDFAPVVRASMADMYYLPPTHITAVGWCLGGVINLTPIELACQLGDSVFAETKAGYDSWLAAPAIQRVFGFDPNERLAAVHGYQPMEVSSHTNTASEKHWLHWLPFADNAQQLAGQNVQKRFNIKQMTVELIHSNYDGFVQQMQAQWQYGYQRTADYIQQHNL